MDLSKRPKKYFDSYLNSIGHSSDEKSKRMKHTRENGMNTTQLEYILQTITVWETETLGPVSFLRQITKTC